MQNKKNLREKLPHELLFEECVKAAGPSVWAIGAGTLPTGEFQWEVFVENEKAAKKLPKRFQDEHVHAIVCPKPGNP